MIDVSLIDESLLAALSVTPNRVDDATQFCAARAGKGWCPNPTFGARFCAECVSRARVKKSPFKICRPMSTRNPFMNIIRTRARLEAADDLRDR